MSDYLQISGVNGGTLSSNPAINGAFALSGYSLGGQTTGADGQTIYDPLSVILSGAEATPALNTLLADAANGTVLSSVTLLVTDAVGNIVDQISLSGATIVNAQQAGQQAALAFDYQSITITPYHQLPNGTYQQGTIVTTTTAGGSFAAAPTPALSDGLTNGSQILQLNVAGDTGPSMVTGFTGDFYGAGYSLSLAGTQPGPLVVNLGDVTNDLGVSNLYADLVNGTVIPSVTLSQVVTVQGSSTVVEKITLNNATVKDYTDPGGKVTVAFDYTSASLTSRTQNADGTYGPPQTVTIGGTDNTAPFTTAIAAGPATHSYLQISGVNGGNPSTNPAIRGAFTLSGYSLGGQTTGADGQTIYDPLSVILSGAEATPAANTLLADAARGTTLSSVTLLVTDAAGNVVDQITLGGATIVNAQQTGQQAALAFDYQSITITPYYQLPDGTYQQGTVVTTTTAGGSFAAAAMPALPDTLTNGNQTLQLNVAGDTGPSLVTGFTGDFAATGYSLSLAGGTPGPLTVNLNAAGNDLGVSNLYADLINGTVIPSVTLSQVVMLNGANTVIEQITLTNATVTDYTDPGGSVTLRA